MSQRRGPREETSPTSRTYHSRSCGPLSPQTKLNLHPLPVAALARRAALLALLLTNLGCPNTAHARILTGDLTGAVGWAVCSVAALSVLGLWLLRDSLLEP